MIGPENTTVEIGACGCDTAILGIGSCEQHSSHLPVETDFFFAGQVSREVAKHLDAILLNPLPYSTSLEHLGFASSRHGLGFFVTEEGVESARQEWRQRSLAELEQALERALAVGIEDEQIKELIERMSRIREGAIE